MISFADAQKVLPAFISFGPDYCHTVFSASAGTSTQDHSISKSMTRATAIPSIWSLYSGYSLAVNTGLTNVNLTLANNTDELLQ